MGRPPKYKTPEELQKKIDEYFAQEKVKITISGLVLFLGFDSRKSFYNYESKDEFLHTIKKARTRVEQHYEEHLLDRYSTGAIFALKNFGWKDTQEIDHNVKSEIKLENLSTEELEKRYQYAIEIEQKAKEESD